MHTVRRAGRAAASAARVVSRASPSSERRPNAAIPSIAIAASSSSLKSLGAPFPGAAAARRARWFAAPADAANFMVKGERQGFGRHVRVRLLLLLARPPATDVAAHVAAGPQPDPVTDQAAWACTAEVVERLKPMIEWVKIDRDLSTESMRTKMAVLVTRWLASNVVYWKDVSMFQHLQSHGLRVSKHEVCG